MKIHNLIRENGISFATVALILCAIAGMKSDDFDKMGAGAGQAKEEIRTPSYRQIFFHDFTPGDAQKEKSPLQRGVVLSESRSSVEMSN